ncbi:hypothetical protein Tco_0741347 [Tanacetum coccineum]
MTINSNLPSQIHEAQVEAFEKENVKDENLHGMDKEFKTRLDETLCIRSKSWLARFRDLREMTMYESLKSNYSIHSGSDKTHHNLKQLYQWPNMETGIVTYATKDNKQLRHDLGNRDHQKDYVNARHKPLEFQVGDKKCLSDETQVIPVDKIQIDNTLDFIEELVEIMDREVKRLKQSRIPIVKVRWNWRRGPESTWEREDQFQKKYPYPFAKSVTAPNITS